jgi:hypothetical protein
MRERAAVAALALPAVLSVSDAARTVPAFPAAEGFGADPPGGRGGRVTTVTNPNRRRRAQ